MGCGTADLSLAFADMGRVVGCDFCRPMLRIGAEKVLNRHRRNSIYLLEADALRLPFADNSFDVVVSAFVLRNLPDIDLGLREMRRILRPGGVMGFLEFGMPTSPLLGRLYRFYFLRVLPRLGNLISGVNGAYAYLPASVKIFPPAVELKKKAEAAGFESVRYRLLTAGIAVLLVGSVRQAEPQPAG